MPGEGQLAPRSGHGGVLDRLTVSFCLAGGLPPVGWLLIPAPTEPTRRGRPRPRPARLNPRPFACWRASGTDSASRTHAFANEALLREQVRPTRRPMSGSCKTANGPHDASWRTGPGCLVEAAVRDDVDVCAQRRRGAAASTPRSQLSSAGSEWRWRTKRPWSWAVTWSGRPVRRGAARSSRWIVNIARCSSVSRVARTPKFGGSSSQPRAGHSGSGRVKELRYATLDDALQHPTLAHGTQDHGRQRHAGEQGARGNRSALPVRVCRTIASMS